MSNGNRDGMKAGSGLIWLMVMVAVAGGSYWLGSRQADTTPTADAPVAAAETKKERKLLYYRNPMGLPDTSPTPKKDSMGMDYIAVYDGEEDEEGSGGGSNGGSHGGQGEGGPAAAKSLKISTEKLQKLGVRVEPAAVRPLEKTLRAAGRIEADERRQFTVAPKFEGYVEKLHVNVTGQFVAKGQPLFEVYSPELVSTQREYALVAKANMPQLADASLARLKNWDISDAQIKALAESGEARRTMSLRSPVAGIVVDKKAVQGMRFMPGEVLYQIADLSSVWVVADVAEQDIGLLAVGESANISISAYPDRSFTGRIAYVYPTLKPETRTVAVRIELANPGGRLKPGMFAQVSLPVGNNAPVLTVPDSAVIDSGARRIVLVQVAPGRFEPRAVKLGARSDSRVEVLEGVKEGEQVVVAANFLIDAESNLRAAVGGMGGH